MVTQGWRIVLYQGRYFVYYQGSDSYPTGLGKDIVSEIPQKRGPYSSK